MIVQILICWSHCQILILLEPLPGGVVPAPVIKRATRRAAPPRRTIGRFPSGFL